MNTSAQHPCRAFTLVELLTVIALIVILGWLLLPSYSPPQRRGPRRQAQMEAGEIAYAIKNYEAEHGKFPVSSNAVSAAARSGQDFTFGTCGLSRGIKTPSGTYDVRSLDSAGNPLSYQANNSEVMAVLLDVESWPATPTVPTINQGHEMNPQKTIYLNARRVADTASPGVGLDGVYRDPWGEPYIITMDFNRDGNTRDAFYRAPDVSADPGDTNTPKQGVLVFVPTVVGGKTFYEANRQIMVWSAGPDKSVDPGPGKPATEGANKDNVLSWR